MHTVLMWWRSSTMKLLRIKPRITPQRVSIGRRETHPRPYWHWQPQGTRMRSLANFCVCWSKTTIGEKPNFCTQRVSSPGESSIMSTEHGLPSSLNISEILHIRKPIMIEHIRCGKGVYTKQVLHSYIMALRTQVLLEASAHRVLFFSQGYFVVFDNHMYTRKIWNMRLHSVPSRRA